MGKSFKKILCSLLVVIMCVTSIPLIGFDFKAGATEYKVGDIIEFGSYPQTQITDSTLVSALNSISATWRSYGYMSGSGTGWCDGSAKESDYMKYKDVTYNNERYRAVEFSTYRPGLVTYKSAETCFNYQASNGYTINNVYWFKFEPIQWRILDPSKGLVLCNSIIDSQAFNNNLYATGNTSTWWADYWKDSARTIYANNYAKSDIKEWLNDDFYYTAFTEANRKIISTQTDGKICLLTRSDTTNNAYGFINDESRKAYGTDYAKAQGLLVSEGSSIWMTQSAASSLGINISCVYFDGHTFDRESNDYGHTSMTFHGVRPVLYLDMIEYENAKPHQWRFNKDNTTLVCSSHSNENFYLSSNKNFKYGRDNFSFAHSEVGSYDISEIGLNYVVPELKLDYIAFLTNKGMQGVNYIVNKIDGNDFGTWGGSCYGIACMDASFLSTLNPSNYGASSVYGLSLDTKLKDSINIMLYSQTSAYNVATGIVNKFVNKNESAVSAAKAISSNGYLPVLCYTGDVSHAVNIIGILPDDFSSDYYVLSIYDCNRADEPRCILISKDYENVYLGDFEFDTSGTPITYYTNIEIKIDKIFTNYANCIDAWAPGLSTSTLYYPSRTKTMRLSNSVVTSSQEDELQPTSKDYIRFLISSEDELMVTANDGTSFVYKNDEIIDSSIDDIYFEKLVDFGITKVVIPCNASSYKISSNNQYYANISHNGKVSVFYCEKGGVSVFDIDGVASVDTCATESYSEISCYKYDLVANDNVVGISISNSSSNMKIDFSKDNPVIESDNMSEINANVQHNDEQLSVENIIFESLNNVEQVKLISENGNIVIEHKEAVNENLCSFCGKIHNTSLWGRIVTFFHNIFYFFKNLFK